MRAQLIARIQKLLENRDRPLLIAVDGPAGSGKSSLAEALHSRFPDSLVIHADDFFLRPSQRSGARLKEPGGNLDRERLMAEVLAPVKAGSYRGHRRYDCQTGQMEAVPGAVRPLVIIEGSYSHHPDLRGYYDLTVFLDIDGETQLQRLKDRCRDAALFARFQDTWIPLENAYFDHFDLRNKADLLITGQN